VLQSAPAFTRVDLGIRTESDCFKTFSRSVGAVSASDSMVPGIWSQHKLCVYAFESHTLAFSFPDRVPAPVNRELDCDADLPAPIPAARSNVVGA